MKKADIDIGMEAAVSTYSAIVKVRVLEVGLPVKYKTAKTGVRFEVIERAGNATFASGRCETRDLDPWTSYHDKRLADLRAEAAFQERVKRVGARLGVVVATAYANRVTMHSDDFFVLAERVGVETD